MEVAAMEKVQFQLHQASLSVAQDNEDPQEAKIRGMNKLMRSVTPPALGQLIDRNA